MGSSAWMTNIFEPDLNMSLPLLNGTTIIQQPVNLNLLTEMYVQEAVGVINSSVAAKQPFFVCMLATIVNASMSPR
jgi:hypothetical protein